MPVNNKINLGTLREFKQNDTIVRALPEIGDDGKISRLIVSFSNGDINAVDRAIANLRNTYEGAIYAETWGRGST